MKKIFQLLIAMVATAACYAQTTVKFNVPNYGDVNAYRYTPGGKRPTIIFFPGNGEVGINAAELLYNGPAKFIASGWRPEFNVIAIQPRGNGTQTHINYTHDFISWAVSLPEVDAENIFLTGLSGGAAMIFEYIKKHPTPFKIKGIIPMSITTDANCELTVSDPAGKLCGTDLRYEKISAWGFCGDADSHFGKMKRYFDRLVAAKFDVTFTKYSGGHTGWNTIYNPSYKVGGVSIYDWAIQRVAEVPEPAYTLKDVVLLYQENDTVKIDTRAKAVFNEKGELIEYRLSTGVVIKPGERWVEVK